MVQSFTCAAQMLFVMFMFINCVNGSAVEYYSNILSGGWQLVRRVGPGNSWHQATDQLVGTDVYGTFVEDQHSASSFSIAFNTFDYDQFLFITGDETNWLVATKESVIGDWYADQKRPVIASSINSNSHEVSWYRRQGYLEDPWISLTDHFSAIGEGNLVYGESSYSGGHASFLQSQNGCNVFVRNSASVTATTTETPTTTEAAATTTAEECDVLLFRQTAGTYLSKDEWLSVGTKDDDNYSILNQLEFPDGDNYRNTDGDFVFTILWPQKTGPNRNVWKQSSNPLVTTEAVSGYQAIEQNFNAQYWGGLATSSSANTLLDGSVGHNHWWYAIGTKGPHAGGIPGPGQVPGSGQVVSQTELWIHVENCAATTTTEAATTTTTTEAATTTTEAATTTTTAESCVDGVPGADWCLSATLCDFFDQENYCNELPAYMNVCCQNTCGTCDVEFGWTYKEGYYIQEQHGSENECYETLDEAKELCMEAGDCFGIATQSNVCNGWFRVTHGGPTFIYYCDWNSYDLYAYEYNPPPTTTGEATTTGAPGYEWLAQGPVQGNYCGHDVYGDWWYGQCWTTHVRFIICWTTNADCAESGISNTDDCAQVVAQDPNCGTRFSYNDGDNACWCERVGKSAPWGGGSAAWNTYQLLVPGRRSLNEANAASEDGTAVQKETQPISRLLNKK